MRSIFKPVFIFIAMSLLVPLGACANPAHSSDLTKVDTQYVCMITNKLFDTPQIPVVVDGKTYYGCCQMCKGKLEGSVEARTATDPISGKDIDKAKAVIGADEGGSIYYFENEANLEKFKLADHPKDDHHDGMEMDHGDMDMAH